MQETQHKLYGGSLKIIEHVNNIKSDSSYRMKGRLKLGSTFLVEIILFKI